MIANSVVLPAPLGPISPVMRPAGAASEAASSASSPPKRFDTRSTANSGSVSVMVIAPDLPAVGAGGAG